MKRAILHTSAMPTTAPGKRPLLEPDYFGVHIISPMRLTRFVRRNIFSEWWNQTGEGQGSDLKASCSCWISKKMDIIPVERCESIRRSLSWKEFISGPANIPVSTRVNIDFERFYMTLGLRRSSDEY